MIAVDTNILVYAHRPEYVESHQRARKAFEALINGTRAWSVPWPCLHEFVGNVTNRRIYAVPMPMSEALDVVSEWAELGACTFIGEATAHLRTLVRIAIQGDVRGAMIHDARIAAICIDHGVTELWTADRDFSRFPDLTIRNPLVG